MKKITGPPKLFMNQNPGETIRISPSKRIFDILVSSLAIIILSPLFLLIILAIKLEGFFVKENRGPIFYTEIRISQGQPFKLKKFRLFKKSAYEPIRDNGEIVHTKLLEKNSANLTQVGKALKKFYLDEMPQLFNVLSGKMSLVGPRPWNPVDYNHEIRLGVWRKKVVKAGLTGPVQVHKLDANKFGGEHKLDYDYIDIQRGRNGLKIVLHDIKLLWQSMWFMLKGQGL